MEATHRAAMSVKGQALLSDLRIEASASELLPTPGARKEAALVFSPLDVDEPCVFK
jgi:hypothetical protein